MRATGYPAPRPSTSVPGFSIPRAAAPEPTAAEDPPPKLPHRELSEIRKAAHRAGKLWPGPVGELVRREVTTYADLGWCHGHDGLMARLVEHILAAVEEPAA